MGKGWKQGIKLVQSAKKGAVFTKLAREISVAAKLGGADPEGNSRLKIAILAAREQSCPKETIERAIRKGAGLEEGVVIEEATYEGKGPYGVGIIVECQTDNKNRTVSELRNMFKRYNGALGETGSIMWMYDRVAMVTGTKANVADPEEDAIEVNANSVEKNEDGSYSFYAGPTELDQLRTALTARGWIVQAAERSYLPKNHVDLTEEQLKEAHELLGEIEAFDDSHRVYANI